MTDDTAHAGATIITPEEAHKAAGSGEVLLIDVRQPEEWKQTGVGAGAEPVSMHLPGFAERIMELTGGDFSTPIALICASGKRSAYMAEQMTAAGFTRIMDVSEGMMGNERGPGWLRSGLPVKASE